MTITVAVFGSSIIRADDPYYEVSVQVGRALASAGYQVVTGGYDGVMEAVSKGASEAGGHVIGVTSDRIRALRGARANSWIAELVHFETLRDRLLHLVWESDGYVVMPGGFGTMLELLTALEFVHARDLTPRPLVAYGPFWRELLDPMHDNRLFRSSYWQYIQMADTTEAIVRTFALWEANER